MIRPINHDLYALQGSRVHLRHSLLLVVGTVVALVWANLDLRSYDLIVHPLHFWVNDIGMAFFFALAAKEVFEATLPGGPWD
jgi:Na+/H+ antiporter NhaA